MNGPDIMLAGYPALLIGRIQDIQPSEFNIWQDNKYLAKYPAENRIPGFRVSKVRILNLISGQIPDMKSRSYEPDIFVHCSECEPIFNMLLLFHYLVEYKYAVHVYPVHINKITISMRSIQYD